MKITVELPESEMQAICEITGLQKKGPAIRKLIGDALMLQQRARVSQKFLRGEWSAELKGYEKAKASERVKSRSFAELWRD